MIRAVVFDLWNTLVHSRGGDPFRHIRAVLTEPQKVHFPALKWDAMARSLPSSEVLLDGWQERLGLDAAQRGAIVGHFKAAVEDTECFPETRRALEETRKVARLALLSNTQSFDMGFLDRLGIPELIAQRFLSAETGFLKPEAEAFETVQKRLGLFPGQLAMVGDSWSDDVQGALEAGWTAIWVNREGRTRPEHDPEADLVEVRDLAQVPEVIERLQAGARCSTCLG